MAITIGVGSIHDGVQYVNTATLIVTATFDEPVTGLTISSMTVSGGGDGASNPVATIDDFDNPNGVGDEYEFELTSYGQVRVAPRPFQPVEAEMPRRRLLGARGREARC